MADFTGVTPAGGGGNGQRALMPWERAKAAADAAASNGSAAGGISDAANLHALQQIKGRIHRRLLERLNLSNLDRLDRSQVAEAIRKVVHDLITQESLPLNFEERDLV